MDKKVFIVWYRGNGYGIFLNRVTAQIFADVIPSRNEKLFGTNQLGQYKVKIEQTTLKQALDWLN